MNSMTKRYCRFCKKPDETEFSTCRYCGTKYAELVTEAPQTDLVDISRNTKIQLHLLGSVAGLVCTIGASLIFSMNHPWRHTTMVPAVVTSSMTEHVRTVSVRSRGSGMPSYAWRTAVNLQYTDNSSGVHSSEMALTSDSLSDSLHFEWGPQDSWNKYWYPGRQLNVFIDPANPSEWSLSQGPSYGVICIALVGLTLLGISGGPVYRYFVK